MPKGAAPSTSLLDFGRALLGLFFVRRPDAVFTHGARAPDISLGLTKFHADATAQAPRYAQLSPSVHLKIRDVTHNYFSELSTIPPRFLPDADNGAGFGNQLKGY
ncbi:hypothetical protein [Thioclava sp. NG1]|uniref:hypothetical protein n=1 Tax=Thioclava sp. NG1 TaxID=2182426 RepID=UPI0011B21A5B|nr:hypothetical protein [Thioclava sp. NG1]